MEGDPFQKIYDAFKDQLISFIDNVYDTTGSILLAIIREKVLMEKAKELFIKFRNEDSKSFGWKKIWLEDRGRILKKDEKYFVENNKFFEKFIPTKYSMDEKKEVLKKVEVIKELWKNFSDDDKEMTWKFFKAFIDIYDVYDSNNCTYS